MQKKEKRPGSEVRSMGENAYFAASNSARGFQSYYPECFDTDEIVRLYAVKGGPGTGKSRFLREVAEIGKTKGYVPDYIYCSSDPNSLDGIILRRGEQGIALLDATAPHVYEPNRPGYREEIVNLGAFWNAGMLREESERIAKLNRAKGMAYRMAYRYLAGYEKMTENRNALVEPCFRENAIEKYAEKLLREEPNGSGFSPQTALIRAIGMRGEILLDTFFANAKRIFLVEDCRGAGYLLMQKLYAAVERKGTTVRVSKNPILSEQIDALALPESGTVFAVARPEECDYPFRQISMRRFVETEKMKEIRSQINYAERMRRAMLAGARDCLREVRKVHFQIEEIYMKAMDFSAKETFTKAFCDSLFRD